MRRAYAGRWILSLGAALTAVGDFLADWNRTDLFNPNWPPHAKFHDAQSILLGLVCTALAFTLYYSLIDKSGRPSATT